VLSILIKETHCQVKRGDLRVGLGLGSGNSALQHIEGALGKVHVLKDATELVRRRGSDGGKENFEDEEEEEERRKAWGLGPVAWHHDYFAWNAVLFTF